LFQGGEDTWGKRRATSESRKLNHGIKRGQYGKKNPEHRVKANEKENIPDNTLGKEKKEIPEKTPQGNRPPKQHEGMGEKGCWFRVGIITGNEAGGTSQKRGGAHRRRGVALGGGAVKKNMNGGHTL